MMINPTISFQHSMAHFSQQRAYAVGDTAALCGAGMKKQGKEKKPDANLVSLVFPDP
jgi:hypothetical protein